LVQGLFITFILWFGGENIPDDLLHDTISEVVDIVCSQHHIPDKESFKRLLYETAQYESEGGIYIEQLSGGGARGIYQIEPFTAECIKNNWMKYNASNGVETLYKNAYESGMGLEWNLEVNLGFQTLIASLIYISRMNKKDHALIKTLTGRAKVYKKYFNTPLGKGTIQGYITKNKKEK